MKKHLGVFILVALVACGNSDREPVACTEEARSSVTLKVLDAVSGDALSEADASFSINGSDMVDIVSCSDSDSNSVNDCDSFPLTYEIAGEFEISVSSPGYEVQTKTVTISKTTDGCHVIGKVLTFNMHS